MTNKFINFFRDEPKVPGKASIFAGLSISIILMYLVNNLRYMGITQLTESHISSLWAFNTVFVISILGYFSFLLYKSAWSRSLVQVLINGAAAMAFYVLYRLFPFNVSSSTLNTTNKVIIVLIIAVFAVSFIVECYRLFISLKSLKRTSKSLPLTPDIDVQNQIASISSSDQVDQTTETTTASNLDSDASDPPQLL